MHDWVHQQLTTFLIAHGANRTHLTLSYMADLVFKAACLNNFLQRMVFFWGMQSSVGNGNHWTYNSLWWLWLLANLHKFADLSLRTNLCQKCRSIIIRSQLGSGIHHIAYLCNYWMIRTDKDLRMWTLRKYRVCSTEKNQTFNTNMIQTIFFVCHVMLVHF